MDCCAGHSGNHQNKVGNHTSQADNQEKKVPWLSITIILLIVGLLVFSILK